MEDHEINQLVAVGMLESLGFQPDVAPDGATGVEKAALGGHVAILMDVQMPGMDGLAATRRIRAAEDPGRRVPIVPMTAGAVAGDRDRAPAAGMDDFLSKPVSVRALAAILERWLDPHGRGPAPAVQSAEDARADDGGTAVAPEADAPVVLDAARLDELDDLSSEDGTSYVDLVVDRFLVRGIEPGEELAAVAQRGDHEQVRNLAHRLKGNSANLGLTELSALAARIEQHGANAEPALKAVAGLEPAFARAADALTSWRATRRARST